MTSIRLNFTTKTEIIFKTEYNFAYASVTQKRRLDDNVHKQNYKKEGKKNSIIIENVYISRDHE